MKYLRKGHGIFVRNDAVKKLAKIDAIIFDCDGVLVDVSKSYDLAIRQTTEYVLEKFLGIQSISISAQIISGFKETGGFNDEVDVTYASILSLTAANRMKLNAKKFINDVIKNADSTGITSVERFLKTTNADISDIKKILQYPGTHSTNPLYKIFDQLFFGEKLYKKIFHKKSQFKSRGLIENDDVIVTEKLIRLLGKKPAIVTGRGLESTKYSLGRLFDKFDVSSSVFLEDHPRKLAKPNPKSLVMSINKLNSKLCIYVGDSMEDLIMAKKANKMNAKTIFCGIYGTAPNPNSKKKLLKKNNADLILESIDMLPKALNLAN